MKPGNKNSYNSLKSIFIDNKKYKFYSLNEAEKNGLNGISKLPKSLYDCIANFPFKTVKSGLGSEHFSEDIIVRLSKKYLKSQKRTVE